ncbi:MAG: HlyD family efflux transporter periplasmic adaptor subunit [Anaerolinea sp.]|nr:HlyD family efflux transporter periplasmic adaptor subunit [Anaerolinea sp.]
MNWKRLLISLILITVLAGGGYWAYLQFLAPQPHTTAVAANVTNPNTIAIDTGADTIAAEAQVVPLAHANLSMPIGGEITALLVAAGDNVQPGDPLLQLDSRDQEIVLQQAETAVLQAQANLATATAGLSAAQVGLDAANVAVTAATAELALLTAPPTAAQIALQEAMVAAAAAGIQQAAGSQAVVLEGSGATAIGVAEAELSAAQAQLVAARIVNEPLIQNEDANAEDRQQAQLRLTAALAGVTAAQARLDELRAGATAAERSAAAGAVGAASGQRDAVQAQLDLLLAGERPAAIAAAQAKVDQAQRVVAEAELRVTQAETAVAQAAAAVVVAQTAVAAAQSALDKMTLTAPFAGVVAHVPVKVGELVSSGFPVLTLADFSEWRIETTDLTELNVVAIKLGDAVNVTIDAFPGVTLRGRIVDIAATAAITRGDVTYAVTIAPDATDLPLRWGMTAFVTARETAVETAVTTNNAGQSTALETTVFSEAALEPLLFANLSLPTGGQVAEIFVAEGDNVNGGDPLLRLDSTDVEIALQQAEAQLATAESGLVVARTQLQLAQAGIDTAVGQVVVAQAQLDLVQSDPLPEEIAATQAGVAAAQAGITQAAGSRDAALDFVTTSAILTAEANLAAATAERVTLENQYETILTTCVDLPDGSEICPLYGPVEEGTRAQLAAARAGEAAAQAALNQLRAGPTGAQQAAAGGGVTIAVANQAIAQARLDLLLAGATPEQVALAAVGVAQAEVRVALAEVRVMEAEAAVAQAEAQAAAARVAVNAAQIALERMTLTAPFAGVAAAIRVNTGELVGPGLPLLTLADFSGWQVQTTDLTELDVARITAGSPVDVRFDAIPNTALSGVVTEVALTPGLSQGDVVYKVTARLQPAPNLPLRWGMTALVDIEGGD